MEQIYQDELVALRSDESRLKSRSRMYVYAKLIFFVGAVLMGYFSYEHASWYELAMAVLSILVYFLVCRRDEYCMATLRKIRAQIKVCQGELAYLKGDFSLLDEGQQYMNPQHEFAYDLDIFGPSSLYQRINRTVTPRGEQTLVHWLTHLDNDAETVRERGEAIAELTGNTSWRLRFLSHTKQPSLLEKLSLQVCKERYHGFLLHSFLPYVFVGATLAVLVTCIFGLLPWSMFLFCFLIQIGLVAMVGHFSGQMASATEGLHSEFSVYLQILQEVEQTDFHSVLLQRLKTAVVGGEYSSLTAFRELSSILNLINQRNNEFMGALLNGVFLYDIWLIRRFTRWSEKALPLVDGWLEHLGQLDALVSLGNYAANHPDYVAATLLPDTSDVVVKAEAVYHPFLSKKKAVPNDFVLKKSHTSIITGANMAGKSTFLRTLGVTYILACNGVPVPARHYEFSLVSLFSSMRTADNLSKDISYFNAELLRLRQLITHVKSHPFTFIILDEILKGTNSKDKLKGSILFLREMAKYPVSVIVATHDLELAKLEKEFPESYRNYCFEIELSDQIHYTYKIQSGVAQNLNASFLLEKILKSS